jgi:hypothetical protein
LLRHADLVALWGQEAVYRLDAEAVNDSQRESEVLCFHGSSRCGEVGTEPFEGGWAGAVPDVEVVAAAGQGDGD